MREGGYEGREKGKREREGGVYKKEEEVRGEGRYTGREENMEEL